MKKLTISLFVSIFILLFGFGCEKNNSSNHCIPAKVIKITCGGNVLQLLTEEQLGEEWKDFESGNFYKNCVLSSDIPSKNLVVGDTINVVVNRVISFSSGNFCDIGGLPSIKVEIKSICDSSLLN